MPGRGAWHANRSTQRGACASRPRSASVGISREAIHKPRHGAVCSRARHTAHHGLLQSCRAPRTPHTQGMELLKQRTEHPTKVYMAATYSPFLGPDSLASGASTLQQKR
eukprot:6204812-Pleurochrysis_carterae.AAC.2